MGEKMNQSRLEPHQLFFIVVQTQIGVGVLSLPFAVHEEAGKDGWLSILVTGAIVQATIVIMTLLAARFPSKNVYEYMPLLIGKWMSRLVTIVMVLFFLSISVIILSNFLIFTAVWVFPRTPHVVFAAISAAISIYLLRENIQVIARFYVVASFLFVTVLLIFAFIFKYLQWENLLPIGSEGAGAIMNGSWAALFSLIGFEVILWLFPLTNASAQTKWKITAGASALSTLLYTVLTVAALAFFNTEELKIVPEPVVYMVKAVELNVVERIDLVFLSIWAVFALTSFMSYLYIASLGAAHVFNSRNHHPALYVLAFLAVVLTLLIQTPIQLDQVTKPFSDSLPFMIIGFPLLLLIISWLRGKKEGEST